MPDEISESRGWAHDCKQYWQKASGGDWAAYAADVSQRANRAHQQGEDVHSIRPNLRHR